MKKFIKIVTFFLKNQTIRKEDFWVKLLKYKFTNKPLVYWYSRVHFENEQFENFGDIITPYLVKKMTNIAPILFRPSYELSIFCKYFIMTGSIIVDARKNSIVWGSGLIKTSQKIRGGRFLAVRGPRTAKRLKELGFSEPSVYGDPALLLPLLYRPKSTLKTYKIGIIPHYVDYEEIKKMVDSFLYNDIKVINLLNNNVEDVVNEIVNCERIISTSLHGVIVANAYDIPTMWWKFSDKLIGDDVKFYDYFESLEMFNVKPIYTEKVEDLVALDDYFLPNDKVLEKVQQNLFYTFPIKNKFHNNLKTNIFS
ncbi:polysaccharide pyruvyl transferase family protein [Flavobacterium cyclinae]|uniref:polysaccharide pyruvyl transferase family protein n=1 Tax=Flavobacterium cyclinae TaxID=2895947 RepID=UPI001E4F8396|nr:polysaccharide pyruvyl transferase family protein [Flavobacterium cyclinae]UGS20570.1 polysaccharide pyruvyl transferase family protein [Flavobacterium cyclinae]